MNEFGLDELNELLKEKIKIEKIRLIDVNQKLEKINSTEYKTINGQTFQGRMEGDKMKLGIYTWPNKQQFKGDFDDNQIKKGEIIFYPFNNKLIGTYNILKESFENCIYENKSFIFEGNIKRNKIHGYCHIKSKENEPFYEFKGKYDEGIRKDKFEIIFEKNGIKYKINGYYKYGKKNGKFKVYDVTNGKSMFEHYFQNDIQLIENDELNEINKNQKINCFELIKKEQKLILILGIENKISLYDVIYKKNLGEYNIFQDGNIITDIIILKNNYILISSNNNLFTLNDIQINRHNIELNEINKFNDNENIIECIFSIKELQNNLIISGHNENIIFWEQTFEKNNIINNDNINNKTEENLDLSSVNENEEINIWDSINSFYINCKENIAKLFKEEKKDEVQQNLTFHKIYQINNLTHTYCFLEIKKEKKENDNIFTIAVAQPDEELIILYDVIYNINNKNEKINIINEQKINKINSIINRKNIMTYMNGILYVGCNDSIKLIDINNVSIIKNILTEKISFINIYRDYYLLCGIIKNKSEYNFLGKLIQYEISDEIIPLYENRQHRHNGSIINCIIFKNNEEEEYFISLGTDKKIIVTKSIPDLKLKSKKITNIKNEIYENNKNNNNESRAEKNIEYEENKNINNIYISPIEFIDY